MVLLLATYYLLLATYYLLLATYYLLLATRYSSTRYNILDNFCIVKVGLDMAILRLEDDTIYTQISDIQRELAPLNIQINSWKIGSDTKLNSLLTQNMLSDGEKDYVLEGLDKYFQKLAATDGYQERDLIVLHSNVPNLDAILSKFDKTHTHADPEVRYIVAGEGIFGFIRPDGSQVELTVQPEDYINVPSGVEHWFYLTSSRQIKAIRYFTTTEGWVPEYTNTKIRLGRTSVVQ